MVPAAIYQAALASLKVQLEDFRAGNTIYDQIVAPRDEVFARYGPVFHPEHIPELTHGEFTSFLYFENNHHWTGLYRQGLRAASDMETLQNALGVLLDEGRPIASRFLDAIATVTGLGKGIATAILLVAHPQRYGVWNNTSEAGLRQIGLWPEFEHGDGLGGRYEKVNEVLVKLAEDLGIDLWTLDALWWYLQDSESLPKEAGGVPDPGGPVNSRFGLERQLEEFLIDNWSSTPLGQDWEIYSTPEDPEAGNQFPTEVGPIDILAVHKTEDRFLVIELKRDQSTDQTVGQALRYLGWVQQELAEPGQQVDALIIAHRLDTRAQYALSALRNVSMMTYEIEFRLNPVASLPSRSPQLAYFDAGGSRRSQ